jgi:steroid delta-isomerase-like uncharacterized protein
MTRADLQEVVERYVEIWQCRNSSALAAYHAANGIVESPMYATLRGRKAIEDAYRAFFTSFPDATVDVEALIIDPPQIATLTTINATHVNEFFGLPGTNRHIEFRNARVMRFDDDRLIAHERRIYDFTGLLLQIGVLRAKPAK